MCHLKMTNRQKELTSIGFVLGLTILLVNDFYLKSYFGNWWTGKLSDFAGLFIFPIFWTILIPRHKDKIYLATILFFIYWKSPFSQHFIDITNQLLPFNISRTVDFSDCIALAILPLSYWYCDRQKKSYITIQPTFILVITSFSFLATSYSTDIDFKKTYDFNYPIDTLKYKIYHLKNINNPYQKEKENYQIDSTGKYQIHKYYHDTIPVGQIPIDKFVKDTMELFVYEDFCFEGYEANIIISGDSKKSRLRLLSFRHSCPENEKTLTKWNDDKEILSESFEKIIISQLTGK
jgi:hypothetical protein